jgi:hypothetical protein
MSDAATLIEHLYDRFKAREIEAALTMLHPSAVWANGGEGGHVHGREGVRSYWTRQWAMIDPHLQPSASPPAPMRRSSSKSSTPCARGYIEAKD